MTSERDKARERERYATDPEFRARKLARSRAWAEAHPERKKALNRRRVTGFTQEDVERFRALQEGLCAICKRTLVREKTFPAGECADHCHTTGRPRGLLCGACNIAIGHYEHFQKPSGLTLDPYDLYLSFRDPIDL